MKFRPIAREILVEYIEGEESPIATPDGVYKLSISKFVVVAVGDGYLTNKGWIPHVVKVGDHVMLKASAKGELHRLPTDLVERNKKGEPRNIARVDIDHVAGVWEGELPNQAPKVNLLVPETAVD